MGKEGQNIMNNRLENNYVESMEQMKFSKEQQERMVDFMVNHVGEKRNHASAARERLPYHIKRFVIAAVCFCMITVGAAVAHATGVLVLQPVSEVFREIFHLGTDTAQISDDVGGSLGISDTDDDVTVTADAVLGDDYNFVIVFSIKKRDGTAFEKRDIQVLSNSRNDIGFRSMEIRTDKKLGTERGYFRFYDVNPDATSIQFLYSCATNTNDSIGAKATASFIDFGYYNSSTKFVPIVTGHWDMTFPLNYADSTRHFAVNQKIKQDGKTIIIKKADVSLVGFYLEFEIRDTGDRELKEEMLDIIDRIPMELVLADGKKINLRDKSKGFSGWIDGNNICASYGNVFYEIIPIEQMDSLNIGSFTMDF